MDSENALTTSFLPDRLRSAKDRSVAGSIQLCYGEMINKDGADNKPLSIAHAESESC